MPRYRVTIERLVRMTIWDEVEADDIEQAGDRMVEQADHDACGWSEGEIIDETITVVPA